MALLILALVSAVTSLYFWWSGNNNIVSKIALFVTIVLIILAFSCWISDTMNFRDLMARIELYEATGSYNEYLAAEIDHDIITMKSYEKTMGGFNFLPNSVLDIPLLSDKAPN